MTQWEPYFVLFYLFLETMAEIREKNRFGRIEDTKFGFKIFWSLQFTGQFCKIHIGILLIPVQLFWLVFWPRNFWRIWRIHKCHIIFRPKILESTCICNSAVICFFWFLFPFIPVKINWRQTNLLRHSVPPKCFACDVQKSQTLIQKVKIQTVKILEEKILEKIFIWPWKKSQKDLLWFPMQIWNWFLTKKLIYSNQSKVKNFCLLLSCSQVFIFEHEMFLSEKIWEIRSLKMKI